METLYFKTLLTVLEARSFSKAAKQLCITQSAVSQRIKYMEEHYRTPLLERSSQAIHATDAGLLVKSKAENILKLELEIVAGISTLKSRKKLAISSTPTFGIIFLPRILNRFFLANSGDVDFKFVLNTPEQALKGVLEKEFDLAVIEHFGDIETIEIELYPLPPDELVFISAPSLALSHPEISLDEILRQRLIARKEGCSSRCLLQDNLSRFGKKLDDFSSIIIYDDLHLTLETVRNGSGVAFVSKSLIKDYLLKNDLYEHSVPGFQCLRFRSVILPNRKNASSTLKNFLENIFEVFSLTS